MRQRGFFTGVFFLCALSAVILTSCKDNTDGLASEAFDTSVSETFFAAEASVSETKTVSVGSDGEYPVLKPLTFDTEKQLIADYAAFIGRDKNDPISSDWISVMHYYGTYNGCEAVIMYGGFATCDMKYITVAGYDFELSSGSYDIMLHKDSAFIDINTAYDEGYLTDEDIGQIYRNYLDSRGW